jgi:hypothetical protein
MLVEFATVKAVLLVAQGLISVVDHTIKLTQGLGKSADRSLKKEIGELTASLEHLRSQLNSFLEAFAKHGEEMSYIKKLLYGSTCMTLLCTLYIVLHLAKVVR